MVFKGMISLSIAIAVAVLLLIFFIPEIMDATQASGVTEPDDSGEEQGIVNNETSSTDGNEGQDENIIEMSVTGFEPQTLTINQGETVIFKAVDGAGRWPATDNHPTHTVYPGSALELCGTDQEDEIFDSCGAVAEGGEYSFTFTEQGEWGFHDHLHPGKTGSIEVK